MDQKARSPDYGALRGVLQKDLNRRITTKEAQRIGEWLLRFYSHLGSTKNGTSVNADLGRQFSSDTTNDSNNKVVN